MNDETNLKAIANGSTRRQAIVGAAMAFGGLVLTPTEARAEVEEQISRTAEAIHQEAFYKAAGSASTKRSPTPNSSTR